MSDCERFEGGYLAWKNGRLAEDEAAALARHAHSCPHCAGLQEGSLRLRELLKNQPAYEPTPGFEWRLERKIKAVIAGGTRERSVSWPLLPRWAALGAGLATGLAVGVILLTAPGLNDDQPKQETQLAAQKPLAEGDHDTLSAKRDSIAVPAGHYDAGTRSRTVSGRR